MRSAGPRALATWAAVCVLAAATASRAQQAAPGAPGGGSSDKVAAEALFEQGRALIAQKKYAEACPKFADSQRLDPSSGTLLNLASCYEKLGRAAIAWATYREAASAASAANRADNLAIAQRHADALAPKLAKLSATVTQAVDGMVLRRDGVEMPRSEWGVPIPIDSGSHTVEAEAPGYKAWSTNVDVPQDGAIVTVAVPALEAAPVKVTPPASAPAPAPVTEGAARTEAPAAGTEIQSGSVGGGQRVAGVAIAAAGIAGLGASAVFAVLAKNTYNDSLANCQPSNPGLCGGTGVSQRNDARTDGNIASVAFGVGAAALVGGALVWLTAPRASLTGAASLVVAPTLGGAFVQGAF